MENIAKYFSDLLSDAFGSPDDASKRADEKLSRFLTEDLEYYFADDQTRKRSESVRKSSRGVAPEATESSERIESKLVKLLKAVLCVLEKKKELRETVLAPAYELLLQAERVLEGHEALVQTSNRSLPVPEVDITTAQAPKTVSELEDELKTLRKLLGEKDKELHDLRTNQTTAALQKEREREKEEKESSAQTHHSESSEDIDRQVRQLKEALISNLKTLSEAEARETQKDQEIERLQAIVKNKEKERFDMEDELKETKKWFLKREKPLVEERALALERLEIMKKEYSSMQKFVEYQETRIRNTEELYSLLLRDPDTSSAEGEQTESVV